MGVIKVMTFKVEEGKDLRLFKGIKMTQNMHMSLASGEKNRSRVSPEICTLLGISNEASVIEPPEHFEAVISKAIVDKLVAYGKDKKQIDKISQLSTLLCHVMGQDAGYCQTVKKASLIYDIGNLKIDQEIYRKDKRLSFEEFEIIKHHTTIGSDLLHTQQNRMLDMAAKISAEHHEWYDGSGYPHGLKRKEISLPARIVALADTVVALLTPRHGREVMNLEKIVAHIQKRRGLHFDPDVVDHFLRNIAAIKEILIKK
jgi:putative two-component system response regulator